MGKVGNHCAFTIPCRWIIPKGLPKFAIVGDPQDFPSPFQDPQSVKNWLENNYGLAPSFTV